jgi:hypothetical protein
MRIPHTMYQIKGRALIRRTIRIGQLEKELTACVQSVNESLRKYEEAKANGHVTAEMGVELRAGSAQITKLKKQLIRLKNVSVW